MRCDLDPSRLAVWWSTEHVCYELVIIALTKSLLQCLKMSAFAVQTLADAKKLDVNNLDVHRMFSRHCSDVVLISSRRHQRV